MSQLKKVLAAMMVLGAMSFLTLNGVFAALNSETINRGGSISSGTLTFTNKVASNTACTSYGGAASPGNVNTACDALFSATSLQYPGTPATVQLTLKNDGSLDASDLAVFMASCANLNTPSVPVHGGADPCASGGAQLYLQETNSSFVATKCWYPTVAAGSCSFGANGLANFDATYTDAVASLDLGSGPVAGASRYFVIGMQLPSTASNALQGQEALFDLTWHLST